jgi:LmbE family N-acetylglucosaminyl deacetylase
MPDGVVAVSPHLDDLALSCAGFLATRPGSLMVTVFAGGPKTIDPLPDWDRAADSFLPGADVVGARREEDLAASAVLGATTRHLAHWDWQYRTPTYGYDGPAGRDELARDVAADLAPVVERHEFAAWVIPLGLVHPDHQATADACLAIARSHPEIEWLVYEDLPYTLEFPGEADKTRRRLRDSGLRLADMAVAEERSAQSTKRSAVGCYRSQLKPLGDRVEQSITALERLYRLTWEDDRE